MLNDPPADVDPYVLVTIRVDSVEPLLQRWPALGLDAPETQVLPPLAPSAYRDVIVKPAQVPPSACVASMSSRRSSTRWRAMPMGADALPLLAFTLEKLFDEFGADGDLTLARYDAMGGVGGSIDQALAQAQPNSWRARRHRGSEAAAAPGPRDLGPVGQCGQAAPCERARSALG